VGGCEVRSFKTHLKWNYGTFNGFIGLKRDFHRKEKNSAINLLCSNYLMKKQSSFSLNHSFSKAQHLCHNLICRTEWTQHAELPPTYKEYKWLIQTKR